MQINEFQCAALSDGGPLHVSEDLEPGQGPLTTRINNLSASSIANLHTSHRPTLPYCCRIFCCSPSCRITAMHTSPTGFFVVGASRRIGADRHKALARLKTLMAYPSRDDHVIARLELYCAAFISADTNRRTAPRNT